MEVTAHDEIERAWSDTMTVARAVLEDWLSAAELDRLDAVAAAHGPRRTPNQLDAVTALAAEYFKPAQQRYKGRVYPETHEPAPEALPWPVPDRVPMETVRALMDVAADEDAASPRAWGAVRLLLTAAVIEAASRAVDMLDE